LHNKNRVINKDYRIVKVVLQATWQQCLDQLRDELPSQQFNTCIRPLHAVVGSESLTLFAPNRFVQDWVKEKFQLRISELVQRLSGLQRVQIQVEVGNSSPASAGVSTILGNAPIVENSPTTLVRRLIP
jgi:chromosomal replication initiation ATPase DnaA